MRSAAQCIPGYIAKLADETRASNTTLADDSTLKFDCALNTNTNFFFVVLFGTHGGAGGYKWDLNFTGAPGSNGGTTYAHWEIEPGATVFSKIGVESAFNVVQASTATGNGGYLEIRGQLQLSGARGRPRGP